MKKRIFAALLALVMLLGALPVTASAAVVSDVKLGEQIKLTLSGCTSQILRRAASYSGGIQNFPASGEMKITAVGESGSKTALPLYDNSYIPCYYGIPSSGSVIVSTPGIIGNCSFDLGPYTYKGHDYPGIRFNYDVLKEGTTLVILTYYVNFTTNCADNSWYSFQNVINISSGTQEKPGKDEINEICSVDGDAVILECIDNDNTNNSHNQTYNKIAPDGIANTYVISDAFKNNGNYDIDTSNTLRYPWMCSVTVYGQPFVDNYNANKGVGKHQLSKYSSWTFYVYYDSLDGEWVYLKNHFPLDFEITATNDPDTMKDIVLSYDGGDHAADKVTGLPASETKRVNTGAKAKFTVSSDVPTCGCGKNCTFLGWMLDGDTKLYVGGDAIELSASATLHAQWREGGSGENPNPGPNPSAPTKDNLNDLLDAAIVTVDCVTQNGHHTSIDYSAKLGLPEGTDMSSVLTELPEGYESRKPAYTLMLSSQKFVDLYSKSTAEGGSGTVHTLKSPENLTWTVYWASGDQTWVVADKEQKTVEAEHTVEEPDVTYTVKYLEKDTNVALLPEKTGKGKHNVPVTETYVQIGGYTVDSETKTITLDKDGTNEIIFYYTKNLTKDELADQLKLKDVIVECMTTSGKHEQKNYTVAQGLPSDISTVVTKNGTNYTLTLNSQTFVDLYDDEIGTTHTLMAQQPTTLTWEFHWDAAQGKWIFTDEVARRLEVEHTVTEPATPPTTEELRPLLGTVEVDCEEWTVVEHRSKEYDVIDGLDGTPQQVTGGMDIGGTHYNTVYTYTISGAKFAQLYSGKTTDTPAGSGVTHTLISPETITCTVWWNPADGTWHASKDPVTNAIKTKHAEYTVTFKYQVNGYSDKTQKVVAGSTVTKPADERREGYTLEGWYETAACTGEAFDFATPINADKTLYAKWTAKQVPYTIQHRDKDTNETVAPDTTGTGAYGEKITLTPKTDIAGYVPAEGNPQYSWLTSEVGNTFTLKYVKLFTVSFDCHMDGMTVAAKTVQRNAKVTSPGALSRTGYIFGGWYKNLSDTTAYNFDAPVTEDFTLHAKWTARTDIPYTVKYVDQDTNVVLKTENKTGTFNETVHESAIQINGYTAVAPTSKDLKLENVSGNELIFYYTKNVGTQVAYTIRYLKEGTTTELLPSYTGTGIVGNTLTVTAPAISGYTCVTTSPQTITLNANAALNVITFYYRENGGKITPSEPASDPFNNNANPRQLNRDDHFAYIKGYPDGTVRPEASLTRAEAAAILYRVMEKSCVEKFHAETSSFRDVPDGKWYTTYVATLEKAGVIVDSKDGNFRPNDAITRAELASMLAQFANVTGGTNTFSDVPATHWAASYIAAAVRSGWIQGYPDGTFRPEQTIKRAEMTAMVNRALGRDPQSASDLLEGMKTWKDNADPTAWFYLDIQEAANGHTYARKTTGEYWTGLLADVVK